MTLRKFEFVLAAQDLSLSHSNENRYGAIDSQEKTTKFNDEACKTKISGDGKLPHFLWY